MEGGWAESGGKKWAGLVSLIAPELCRKNKLSCRRRAELGWAERGEAGRVRLDLHQSWKSPQFHIKSLGTFIKVIGEGRGSVAAVVAR